MTTDPNTGWNHYQLGLAVAVMRMEAARITALNAHVKEALNHAATFIEHNMKEMEINGGNGSTGPKSGAE